MVKSSFAAQKAILDDACLVLRSFTLGQQGVTQRDGAKGIEQVNLQCDRLMKLFGTGAHAMQSARLVAAARTRIAAAQARLSLLNKKSPW